MIFRIDCISNTLIVVLQQLDWDLTRTEVGVAVLHFAFVTHAGLSSVLRGGVCTGSATPLRSTTARHGACVPSRPISKATIN